MCLFSLCLMSQQQIRSYGDKAITNKSSDSLKKLGIKLVTIGLQGELFIHYTTRFNKLI